VKAAKTNESRSYAHTLAANTHYFSRPGNASVGKGGKQKEETRAQDKQARAVIPVTRALLHIMPWQAASELVRANWCAI
jgi:hypothetical protein